MLKMSQNMGQIQFSQYVESRGQGEVLRPRDCALLWDSMGCLRVTGPEEEQGGSRANVHSSALSVQAIRAYESLEGCLVTNDSKA